MYTLPTRMHARHTLLPILFCYLANLKYFRMPTLQCSPVLLVPRQCHLCGIYAIQRFAGGHPSALIIVHVVLTPHEYDVQFSLLGSICRRLSRVNPPLPLSSNLTCTSKNQSAL